MRQTHSRLLIRDPELPWDGPFPYDYLARLLGERGSGIVSPDASAAAIKEVFYDLLESGTPGQAARQAWDELRQIDRRLVVDFFMYELPASDLHEVAEALSRVAMPLDLPDFHGLAHVPLDPAALQAPDRFEPGPEPQPAELLFGHAEIEPVDIGAVTVGLFELIDEER